jgi:hypothetical protein
LLNVITRVRGVSGRNAVGLPDVQFGAAGTKVTNTRVRVTLGSRPAVNIALSSVSNCFPVHECHKIMHTNPLMNLMSRGH